MKNRLKRFSELVVMLLAVMLLLCACSSSAIPETESGSGGSGERGLNNDSKSVTLQIYHDLLHSLKDDGTFLQFAHMEDLDNDGVEELMLLHDNTKFTLYTIDHENEKAEAIVSEEYVDGFMCYEEMVQNETYAEAAESVGEEPYVRIRYSEDHSALLISKSTMDLYAYTIADCKTWSTSDCKEIYDSQTGQIYAVKDGQKIDDDTFYSLTIEDTQYDFPDELNFILAGELPDTASKDDHGNQLIIYKDFLNEYLTDNGQSTDNPDYFQLIYIDDDEIPELILSHGSSFSSQVELYSIQDGEVTILGENLGSNGEIFYIPNQNKILSTINKESGTATLYEIRDGYLNKIHSSSMQTGMDGMYFTIDGQNVSEEDGLKFWGWDENTEFISAGTEESNASLLDEENIDAVLS